MVRAILSLVVIAWLPGALIFRLPGAERSRRAALPADERFFWSVVLSLTVTSGVALALAAIGWYRFNYLVVGDAVVGLLILAVARGRLRFDSRPTALGWTAALPVALGALSLGLNFFVPPSEYIVGGRDPGVYMNEGIQIAQRGALAIDDSLVRAVPAASRDLFFPPSGDPAYFSNRFMGFFLLNPDTGTVVGQFPPLYPIWIAIAYGINGLSGARWVLGFWAALGVLAVYFLGCRLAGRAAASAGAALLAVHVVQIWFARFPNAELLMQPLVFAALLAAARTLADDDWFFAPVCAALLTLAIFAHLTGLFLAVAVGAAFAAFGPGPDVARKRGPNGRSKAARLFWLPAVVGAGTSVVYVALFIPPYFEVPLGFARNLQTGQLLVLMAATALGLGLLRVVRGRAIDARVRVVFSLLAVTMWALAVYAYFFRSATAGLAPHDADSLRTFTLFYLTPYGLAAAMIGLTLLAGSFQPAAGPFLLTFAAFSLFFFYKIRIVPEHFWAARRFAAVVLPGAMLLVGVAAFGDPGRRRMQLLRRVAGLILLLLFGRYFLDASRPILRHVEYAGVIPELERLAAGFGADDLVLVEARGASDAHVLGLPLAYVYARHVLVLASTTPDKAAFHEFLTWARTRYHHVFFMGEGGTDLLSRHVGATPTGTARFQVPEYEPAWNSYPRRSRPKPFDLGLYELSESPTATTGRFTLAIGTADDLRVLRFHAKERHPDGTTYRWTRDVSYISILGTAPAQQTITLWMGNGGRPAAAGLADVEVFLADERLGAVIVDNGMSPYRFDIPPAAAAAMAQSEHGTLLRIVSRTWNPAKVLGGADDRDLGVMVDKIDIQ